MKHLILECLQCDKTTDGASMHNLRCAYCGNTDQTRMIDDQGKTIDEYMRYREALLSLQYATTILSAYDIASVLRERGIVRGIDYRGCKKHEIWAALRKREYGVVVDIKRLKDAILLELEAKAEKYHNRIEAAHTALAAIDTD